MGSRVRRALLGGPVLDRPRARRVQRLVRRQDEPGPPVLHSLDLAVTRFSGRDAPPIDADPVTQEAYSRELISFGFWAGDDNLGDAAFYSYTAPEPDGLRDQALIGGDPRTTLLAFVQSAYEAGARTAGWDTSSFESSWCPTPAQLDELRTTAANELGRRPASRSTVG